jgi:hypothetical protein
MPMPPRLDPDSPTEKVQILAPKTLWVRVDEWRRKHPDLPNRSEAIRLLLLLALDLDM